MSARYVFSFFFFFASALIKMFKTILGATATKTDKNVPAWHHVCMSVRLPA
jgi:hypothetical protein